MSQPEPNQQPESLVTIDLSGAETGTQALGRIVGGIVLLIVGAVVAIGSLFFAVRAWFVPSLEDWADLIGDGLFIVAAIGLGIAAIGFELLRRGRRARAAGLDVAAAVLDSGEPRAHIRTSTTAAPEPTTSPKRAKPIV
jgi:hypothetical protein